LGFERIGDKFSGDGGILGGEESGGKGASDMEITIDSDVAGVGDGQDVAKNVDSAKTGRLDVEIGGGGFEEVVADGDLAGGKSAGNKGGRKLGVTIDQKVGANDEIVVEA